MDATTIATYEHSADRWIGARTPKGTDAAGALAARVGAGEWRADLGCGPGWHVPHLGEGGPVLALDATRAMARRVREFAPGTPVVVGDLEALPVRAGALGGAWAKASYQHLPVERLPLALADLHRATRVGAPATIVVTSDRRAGVPWDDPFGPRHFAYWPSARLRDVVEGAGFRVEAIEDDGIDWLTVHAVRERTLADIVGPRLRLLIVGLNPSLYAADHGVGFARPGNRFWPALIASGLASRDRDPRHACAVHGIGFTDLVKRATPRADALERDEYVAGAARVARLVEWLAPQAICFAGLSGYRSAIDRRATTGWQRAPFGGRPAYVMPNPSGLNTHTDVADLASHLLAASAPNPPPIGAQPREIGS
jgi:TDG/mug DNA glycosylase family protein